MAVLDPARPEWSAAQERDARIAEEAGLPPSPSGYARLGDAIQRAKASGYDFPHFWGADNEPTGDRPVTMDQENLVQVLKRKEQEELSSGKKDSAAVTARERAYWEKEIQQYGMTADQWKQQTGESDPVYPALAIRPNEARNTLGLHSDPELREPVARLSETPLSPTEESVYQTWKQKVAPNDSGADYDLRGAFKAGVTPDPQTGHWPDTFKKPNHPTFSNESQYATPDAGHWDGDTFVPASKAAYRPNPEEPSPWNTIASDPRYQSLDKDAKKTIIDNWVADNRAWGSTHKDWDQKAFNSDIDDKANELRDHELDRPRWAMKKLDYFGYRVAKGGLTALEGLFRGIGGLDYEEKDRRKSNDVADALRTYRDGALAKHYGVTPEDDKVTSNKVVGAAANVFDLAAGPAMMITKLASQTYSDGYDQSVAKQNEEGTFDPKQIDAQARKEAVTGVVEMAPVLAAYALGGKIASLGATKLLPKNAPAVVRGLVGGSTSAATNMGVSGGVRVINDQPFVGDTEQNLTDAFFGVPGGLHEGLREVPKVEPKASTVPPDGLYQTPSGTVRIQTNRPAVPADVTAAHESALFEELKTHVKTELARVDGFPNLDPEQRENLKARVTSAIKDPEARSAVIAEYESAKAAQPMKEAVIAAAETAPELAMVGAKVAVEEEKLSARAISERELTPKPAPEVEPVPETEPPVMITRAMESQLRKRGMDQDAIDGLTPAQAHEILQARVTPGVISPEEQAEAQRELAASSETALDPAAEKAYPVGDVASDPSAQEAVPGGTETAGSPGSGDGVGLVEAPAADRTLSPAPEKAPRKLRGSADAFGSELTPVAAFVINDMGGLMSKGTAKKLGLYERNSELWDGAPVFAHPSHNKIYASRKVPMFDRKGRPILDADGNQKSKSVGHGGETPDHVAAAAFEAGLIPDAYPDTMWAALQGESKTARSLVREDRRQVLEERDAEQQATEEENDPFGSTNLESLSEQERAEIEGTASRDDPPPSARPSPDQRFDSLYQEYGRGRAVDDAVDQYWNEIGFQFEEPRKTPTVSAEATTLKGLGSPEANEWWAQALKLQRQYEGAKKGPQKASAKKAYDKHLETLGDGYPGILTVDQAQARWEEWGKQLDQIGEERRSENGNKIILSLFDRTGVWAEPFLRAGYDVRTIDLEIDDVNVLDINRDWLTDYDMTDIHGVLAANPCTDFAVSGARWWKDKDADGRTEASIKLLNHTVAIIEYLKPSFWALENPVGRIDKLTGIGKPLLQFQPHNFGDPYTKRTQVWGNFNPDLPQANVFPSEGSKVHKLRGDVQEEKDERSKTPQGFALAFAMANFDHGPAERVRQILEENGAEKTATVANNAPLDPRKNPGFVFESKAPTLKPGEEQGTLVEGETKTPEQLEGEKAQADAELQRQQNAQDVRVGAAKPLRAGEDIRPEADMFNPRGSDELFDQRPPIENASPLDPTTQGLELWERVKNEPSTTTIAPERKAMVDEYFQKNFSNLLRRATNYIKAHGITEHEPADLVNVYYEKALTKPSLNSAATLEAARTNFFHDFAGRTQKRAQGRPNVNLDEPIGVDSSANPVGKHDVTGDPRILPPDQAARRAEELAEAANSLDAKVTAFRETLTSKEKKVWDKLFDTAQTEYKLTRKGAGPPTKEERSVKTKLANFLADHIDTYEAPERPIPGNLEQETPGDRGRSGAEGIAAEEKVPASVGEAPLGGSERSGPELSDPSAQGSQEGPPPGEESVRSSEHDKTARGLRDRAYDAYARDQRLTARQYASLRDRLLEAQTSDELAAIEREIADAYGQGAIRVGQIDPITGRDSVEGGNPNITWEQFTHARDKYDLGGSVHAPLEVIAEVSSNPLFREVAQILRRFVDAKTRIHLDATLEDRGLGGTHFANENRIVVNPYQSDARIERTILHEALHAATQGKIQAWLKDPSLLTKREHEAISRLEDLRQQMLRKAPAGIREIQNIHGGKAITKPFADLMEKDAAMRDYYGLMSLPEFMTEIMTNEKFGNLLRETKAEGTNKTVWQHVVDLLAKLIGAKPGTVLHEGVARVMDLLKDPRMDVTERGEPIRSASPTDPRKPLDEARKIVAEHPTIEDAVKRLTEDTTISPEVREAGLLDILRELHESEQGAPAEHADQVHAIADNLAGKLLDQAAPGAFMKTAEQVRAANPASFERVTRQAPEPEETVGGVYPQTKPSALEAKLDPQALQVADPVPSFLETAVGSLTGKGKGGLWESIKAGAGGVMTKMFPKTHARDRVAGEKMVRWIASRDAAPHLSEVFSTSVLEGLDLDANKFGAALAEDNLRSIEAQFLAEGDTAGAAGVYTFIGAPKSPFATEAEYQEFLAEPATKKAIERHRSLWESNVEPMYRNAQQIDPSETLPERGDQTGARVNLMAILGDEGQGTSKKNVVTGMARGNLTGTMRKKGPFGTRAKGSGQAYNINYHEMMANTYARQLEIANKFDFEQHLVATGNAIIGKPGRAPALADGEATVAFPLRRRTLVTKGKAPIPLNQSLYVRKSLALEYRRAANVDLIQVPQAFKTLTAGANHMALAGLTDASVHVLNLGTAIALRPATASHSLALDTALSLAGNAHIPVAVTRAVVRSVKDNRAQIAKLAEIGAFKQKHTTWNPLSHVIKWADKTVRLALDDSFSAMAKSGLVKDTETNRRDFVNQVGQYNIRGQGTLVRLARDTGLGPFATAGTNFNAMGLRTATMSPGMKASNGWSAAALRANVMSKWIGAFVFAGALNYMLTGKVAGRPGTPIGSIDTGRDDENGRPQSFSYFNLVGLGRAMRVTGARGAIEARRKGLPLGDQMDAAGRDIWNSAIGPFVGPVVRFGTGVANTTLGLGVPKPHPVVPPTDPEAGFFSSLWNSQVGSNVRHSVVDANPVLQSGADLIKPEGHWMDAVKRQLPRLTLQSTQPAEMIENYPEIVHKAQLHGYIDDIIGRARKMAPETRQKFLDEALAFPSLTDEDRKYAIRTFKYRRIQYSP